MRPKSTKKVSIFLQIVHGFLACSVPWPECLAKLFGLLGMLDLGLPNQAMNYVIGRQAGR